MESYVVVSVLYRYLTRFHKLFCALVLIGAVPNTSALANSIWLAPKHQSVDYMDLFAVGAPWPNAASHIQVFKIYPTFVIGASDADLRTVIAWLSRRKIALALEFGLLSTPNNVCGKVEGYCGQFTERAAARIKALGGTLAYVAMDEPLWNGNLSSIPSAQHTPIAMLAADVATQVATIHHYFPNAQVGDIEPLLGIEAPSNYVALIQQWVAAYEAAVGQPLAFFHADVNWQATGWAPQLSQLSAAIKLSGIRFGILYNGGADADSDAAWAISAEQHFAQLETMMAPDDAVIQSWTPDPPVFTLPETRPGTMTYLVDRYIATETILNVSKTSNGFTGNLTALGLPVAESRLYAYEIDDGTLNIWSTPSLAGVVPAGATQALFGLRINLECNCRGPVDILLGSARFVDDTLNTTVTAGFGSINQRITLPEGEPDLVNTAQFPVVAGDPFTFSVAMQAAYSSEEAGYVSVIFEDQHGAEIKRARIHFTPAKRLIWASSTGYEGDFVANIKASSSPIIFDYPGNSNLRLSSHWINGAKR